MPASLARVVEFRHSVLLRLEADTAHPCCALRTIHGSGHGDLSSESYGDAFRVGRDCCLTQMIQRGGKGRDVLGFELELRLVRTRTPPARTPDLSRVRWPRPRSERRGGAPWSRKRTPNIARSNWRR